MKRRRSHPPIPEYKQGAQPGSVGMLFTGKYTQSLYEPQFIKSTNLANNTSTNINLVYQVPLCLPSSTLSTKFHLVCQDGLSLFTRFIQTIKGKIHQVYEDRIGLPRSTRLTISIISAKFHILYQDGLSLHRSTCFVQSTKREIYHSMRRTTVDQVYQDPIRLTISQISTKIH